MICAAEEWRVEDGICDLEAAGRPLPNSALPLHCRWRLSAPRCAAPELLRALLPCRSPFRSRARRVPASAAGSQCAPPRTSRRKVQGCAFQSIPGNQLSSTRMNRQNRYIWGGRGRGREEQRERAQGARGRRARGREAGALLSGRRPALQRTPWPDGCCNARAEPPRCAAGTTRRRRCRQRIRAVRQSPRLKGMRRRPAPLRTRTRPSQTCARTPP